MGRPILFSVFIDKLEKRADGFLITDRNGKPLASAEILEHRSSLPTKILFVWYEEDRALLLELKNPQGNVKIPTSYWAQPDYQPRINMADE